jgi:hypothetical protein
LYFGWQVGRVNDVTTWKGALPTWEQDEAWFFDGIVPDVTGATRIIWRANEGAGTTAISSPAGYDATVQANSWTTSTRSKKRAAA